MNQAKAALTSLSFGEEGYFFLLDKNYIMLAHPSDSVETGESWEAVSDSTGRQFVKLMIDQAVKEGSGFIEYEFPKLGEDEAQPKLGFMEYFEPWGWAVGTGLYMDFVDDVQQRIHEETLLRINMALYDDLAPEALAYPIIKTRDDIYIAYIDKAKLGTVSSSKDKKTDEDLTSMYFEVGDGPIEYYFSKPGEDRAVRKIGHARVVESLDWVIVFAVYEDLIIESVRQVVLVLILSGVVTIVLISTLIYVILMLMSKKIKNAAAGFEEFATGAGDLTRRLDGRGKPVGFPDDIRTYCCDLRSFFRESVDSGGSRKSQRIIIGC